jgi:hypothetical protein
MTEEERRKKRNEELIDRMRAGESLHLYKASDTFFPPRPLIKKDKKLIKILFEENHEEEK